MAIKEAGPRREDVLTQLRQYLDQYQDRPSFESMLGDFAAEKRVQIMEAFDIASICHKGQKRDEGTDFIIHPARTALTAIFFGERDVKKIQKDLFHDSMEDSDYWVRRKRRYADRIRVGKRRIAEVFGEEVAEGVDFATKFESRDVKGKTKGIRKGKAESVTHDKFAKGTPEQQVSKMPDRLHNVLTVVHIGRNRGEGMLDETEEFYIPIWEEAVKDFPVYQPMLAVLKLAVRDARKAIVRVK